MHARNRASQNHGNGEPGFAVRLGLRYVKGLRAEIAADMVRERAVRPFAGIEDLKLRVPAIQKSELAALAEIGALNFIAGERGSARTGPSIAGMRFGKSSARRAAQDHYSKPPKLQLKLLNEPEREIAVRLWRP